MRLGVFSDVHSNVHAFDEMCRRGGDVDRWISLGDAVGLFPSVNEVLDRMRRLDVIAIRGNHEDCLVSGRRLENSFTGNEALEKQRHALSPENRGYLESLPGDRSFRIGGRELRMVHALNEGTEGCGAKYAIDLGQADERFRGAEVVLFGDTHLPAVCYCRSLLLVNPGSSGFPIDLTHRPSFAVLNTADFSCEVRRFDYDKDALVDEIRSKGYNEALSRFVQTGTWGS